MAELPAVDRVIQAQGLAVTPAGLDIRSPVARLGQNYLRLWGGLPSPRELGETYALLGYTHIHEPYLTLQTANYVHQELAALPVVDTSASLVVNLQDVDLWLQDPEKLPAVGDAWAYFMTSSRALDLRVVEPFVRFRQDYYRHRTLATEAVVERLLHLLTQRGLRLTLEATPELLAAQLPVQPGFHISGLGAALTDEVLAARALSLLAAGIPGDMGLLPPAPRPDLPRRPVRVDQGWLQPFDLNPTVDPAVARRSLRLAVQARAYGLAFSVASLLQTPPATWPRLFSWLADADSRRRDWGRDLPSEEYHFLDWLRATRTLPAQYLGLPDRGHLQPGARADVALYDLPGRGGWQESCRRCRLLLKAGEIVVQNYAVVQPRVAKTTYFRHLPVQPNQLVADICQYRSFRFEHLRVQPQTPIHWQQVN